MSEPIDSFGLWVEQLIAESTGKQGKGILPVAGEPIGDPDDYGEDRVFVYLRNADEPDKELDEKIDALGRAGHPVVKLEAHGAADLGRIFFFSEFAVAVAAGCSASTRSTSRTCRRRRTTRTRCSRRASCRRRTPATRASC